MSRKIGARGAGSWSPRGVGRHPKCGQVVECHDSRLFAGRDDEPAVPELEVDQVIERSAGFSNEIQPSDAGIRDAIRHKLGYVLRSHEERPELAPEGRRQRPITASTDLETSVRE